MRIVTRPDFDGIVCAVLLFDVLDIQLPVKWVEPSDIQKGHEEIREGDVLANLPFDKRCSIWFDHHYTNEIDEPFEGSFKMAPSAARVIFQHYHGKFSRDYSELVAAADKIDSADLTIDEVTHPERYPYVLLSMTVKIPGHEEAYWNHLVTLLCNGDIASVMEAPEVQKRCQETIEENEQYRDLLLAHTQMHQHVSVTDFRMFNQTPSGNRFLVFSMLPESVVNVKIHHHDDDPEKIVVHLGHSIFNRNCRVNVGKLLAGFEGGGHRGAGATTFSAEKADDYIPKILDALVQNESNE